MKMESKSKLDKTWRETKEGKDSEQQETDEWEWGGHKILRL